MNPWNLTRLLRALLRVESIPYAVFSAIGLAVLWVVAGIALDVLKHGGLLPPPAKPELYACSAPSGNFTLRFLVGTDSVQIKAASGLLDGRVRQQQFDWQGFAQDRSLLGFAPPASFVLEDGQPLRVSGPDMQDLPCTRLPDPTTPARPPST